MGARTLRMTCDKALFSCLPPPPLEPEFPERNEPQEIAGTDVARRIRDIDQPFGLDQAGNQARPVAFELHQPRAVRTLDDPAAPELAPALLPPGKVEPRLDRIAPRLTDRRPLEPRQ